MKSLNSLVLIASLGLTTSCLQEGDIASSGCPVTEDCSESTPNGLYFQGASFSDSTFPSQAVKTIAVGGTQRVRIATGNASDSTSFSLPYDAKVDGEAFTVGVIAGASLELTGNSLGSAKLRILEPESEILYERVSVAVAEVTHVEIEANSGQLFSPTENDAFGNGIQDDWALFEGGSTKIVARLYSGETRVVDQSMVIEGGTARAWDRADIDSTGGDLALSLTLTNGTRYDVDVPIVSELDEIVVMERGRNWVPSEPVAIGTTEMFCLSAFTDGRAVAGIPWEVTPNDDMELSLFGNCVQVGGAVPGRFPVVVNAGGISKEFTIEVVDAVSEAQEPISPTFATPPMSAGDRALVSATQ